MQQAGSNGSGDGGLKQFQGLVSGVLLSIPLWICIGVVIAVFFQNDSISKLQSAILFVAAAAEFILLRRFWRATYPRTAYRAPPVRAGTATPAPRIPHLKQTFLLLGLVGAYLHYYFWDVQLQIASMHSVTVFVQATALG